MNDFANCISGIVVSKICEEVYIYEVKYVVYVNIKRSGPRLEPCGMPDKISLQVLNELLTLVLCFLLDR